MKTILEKFDKIEHKLIFYTEVYVQTGTAVSTIRCTWFNKSKGINIPTLHLDTVHKCLDRCLKYEAKVRAITF